MTTTPGEKPKDWVPTLWRRYEALAQETVTAGRATLYQPIGCGMVLDVLAFSDAVKEHDDATRDEDRAAIEQWQNAASWVLPLPMDRQESWTPGEWLQAALGIGEQIERAVDAQIAGPLRATIAARDATIAGLREALTAAANLYAPCRPSHGPAYCSRCGGILDLEHDADRTHRHPCDACAARTLRELLTTPTPPVASEETHGTR